VPPEGVAVAVPFVPPLQPGSVPVAETVNAAGGTRVVLADMVHPLESVTVTV